ncbi:hypothetical protein FJY94_01990 [Candidatus Kaiserbacteria bacterium]|nr:hypothetical protein [Candidatus Kaiserbacteria bacterium]
MTEPRNVLDLHARKRQLAHHRSAQLKRPARTASATLEERQRGSRTRRRKLRALAAVLFLFFLAGAAYGVGEASYLQRFAIGAVAVDGAETIPPRLVEAYVDTALYDGSRPYISRTTLFTYKPDQLAAGVVAFFPRVREARVERSSMLGNGITIVIKERTPFARWCKTRRVEPPAQATSTEQQAAAESQECYLMDDGGFVFAAVEHAGSAVPETSYVFSGGLDLTRPVIGQRYAPAHLPGMLALIRSLTEAGFAPYGASQRGSDDFAVELEGGFTVLASFGQSVADLTRNLDLVLSSQQLRDRRAELEYVDMRFGDRVYYRFWGETKTASSSGG